MLAAQTTQPLQIATDACESCIMTLYRFDSAPLALRQFFRRSKRIGWLAHVDATAADSIDSTLANWAMTFRVKDRHELTDGSVVLAGDFDLLRATVA